MNDFDVNDGGEWFLVHSGAVTNTNPGSMVEVRINTERICQNMTNSEFRGMILRQRDRAVSLVEQRILELQRWSNADKARVLQWFGKADEATCITLLAGLTAISRVLKGGRHSILPDGIAIDSGISDAFRIQINPVSLHLFAHRTRQLIQLPYILIFALCVIFRGIRTL